MNLRVGPLISAIFAPGYGRCGRCRTAWLFVEEHSTFYCPHGAEGDCSGLSSLCEKCWSELTPEARWPFYAALLARWGVENAAAFAAIRTAVMEGR